MKPPLVDLGATYDDHLRLIGKHVVNFLLALIEIFSLGVMAEVLRAIIGSKSAILLQWGPVDIGVDLAGLLGGRMASAEGGSVSSGVAYGEGCPLSSRLRDLGSVVSSPSGVRGKTPAENGFWRILKATERLFVYLYDKILGRGGNLH